MAPLVQDWAGRYRQGKGLRIDYTTTDSAAGLAAVRERRVDVGFSDIPLTQQDVAPLGLARFPVVVVGVAPVVHLDGVGPGELSLSPSLLADIFRGAVTRWDDPRLVALNPSLTLPAAPITVVHRSDSCGTNWIFSHYLSSADPTWQREIGVGAQVGWAPGPGAVDSEQMAHFIDRFPTTIGYVGLAWVDEHSLADVRLVLGPERSVRPSADTVARAAAGAVIDDDGRWSQQTPGQPGGWPIIGATYAFVQRSLSGERRVEVMLGFLDWVLREGGADAHRWGAVLLLDEQVQQIEASWARDLRVDGAPVWHLPEPEPEPDTEPADVPASVSAPAPTAPQP